jgi:pimeloyl-ACP methyl ester carboxylesterase
LSWLAGWAQVPAAIAADPVVDKVNPARMDTVQIPSHGNLMNGLVYVAAGAGPHPVVVLLHGFPGNEKNLDLAQAIRRAGWDVLYFDYRGSWGTPGDFSFTHCMEDTHMAIDFMRDPSNAKKLRADPARIILIGHSMGGMIAAHIGAEDQKIMEVGLISAADMASGLISNAAMADRTSVTAGMSDDDRKRVQNKVAAGLARAGLAPLADCTPEDLAAELMAHTEGWKLVAQAQKLASRPVLIITSDDGLAPSNDALAAGIQAAGDHAMHEVQYSAMIRESTVHCGSTPFGAPALDPI